MNVPGRRQGFTIRRALLVIGCAGCLGTAALAIVCSVWRYADIGISLAGSDFFLIAHGGGIVELGFHHAPGSSTKMGPIGLQFHQRFESVAEFVETWKTSLTLPSGSRFIRYYWLEIPLWLPLLLSALTVFWARRGARPRNTTAACRTCGYDLTGNLSGRCPECGTPVATGQKH